MNDMIYFELPSSSNVIFGENFPYFFLLIPVFASCSAKICKKEVPRYCINIWVLRWQWRGGACSLVHHFYLCKHPLQLVKLFAGYERVVIGALQLDYVCPAAVGGYVVYVVQVYYVGLVAAEEGGRV